MNMAERIQALRKANGLSQEELAEKMGVSRQAVSKWESEQSTPDLDKILMMSDLFAVTTDYILKGTEAVEPVNAKPIYSLYAGMAVLAAAIAGIWAFTANRFRIDECLMVVLAGAVIGCAAGFVLQVLVRLLRK